MAGNAIITANQENGSKVYFESVIERGLDPDKNFAELLKVVKKVYPDVTTEWMSSYAKQVKALKSYIGRNKGYEYSRDEANGFMVFIESIAKSKCGVSQKDRWNPADIYMIKTLKRSSIENKIKELTDGNDKDTNLLALNDYMRVVINNLEMLPISLKAIKSSTKTATAEPANMGNAGKNLNFSVVPGSVKCIMDFGHKIEGEFDTGEIAFDFTVNGMEVHGQSRNFQYSQSRNIVQTDLTPKGSSGGAKLGKVSSVAIDNFLNSNQFSNYGSMIKIYRPSSPSKDPNIDLPGKWTQQNIDYWINYIDALNSGPYTVAGSKINLGNLTAKVGNQEKKGAKEIIQAAIAMENSTRSASGRFSSKLIGLRWAYIWVVIEQNGLMTEWLKTLYYGAKKEFSDKNGPFIKIS